MRTLEPIRPPDELPAIANSVSTSYPAAMLVKSSDSWEDVVKRELKLRELARWIAIDR
jgi:hypothetical protein